MNINDIEDITVAGVDRSDYPDICDAYPDHAVWKSTGIELTDDELESLHEQYPDEIHELAHESIR